MSENGETPHEVCKGGEVLCQVKCLAYVHNPTKWWSNQKPDDQMTKWTNDQMTKIRQQISSQKAQTKLQETKTRNLLMFKLLINVEMLRSLAKSAFCNFSRKRNLQQRREIDKKWMVEEAWHKVTTTRKVFLHNLGKDWGQCCLVLSILDLLRSSLEMAKCNR